MPEYHPFLHIPSLYITYYFDLILYQSRAQRMRVLITFLRCTNALQFDWCLEIPKLDVHNSPDPFSRVSVEGLGTRLKIIFRLEDKH